MSIFKAPPTGASGRKTSVDADVTILRVRKRQARTRFREAARFDQSQGKTVAAMGAILR
jgi:hypothetical protein